MSVTLVDSHQQFIRFLESSGKAKSTVVAYSKDIEQLIDFVSKADKTMIDSVHADDIDNFKDLLKKQRYTSKSISRKVNSIKAFFRFLNTNGFVEADPAKTISHPKFKHQPPRILSRMEYRALRDACKGDARISAIIELLLQTGMRISELAALQMSDIDLTRNVLHIRAQQSRDSRRVPLNKAAKTALINYLNTRPKTSEPTVFLTKTCRPFLVRNIRTSIDRYFRLAGIKDAKVNDLRHTFIVEQLKAGTPLIYVSQLVGHKRITTTEKYLKLVDAPDMNPSVKIEEL